MCGEIKIRALSAIRRIHNANVALTRVKEPRTFLISLQGRGNLSWRSGDCKQKD
jgi:hypothetical protein